MSVRVLPGHGYADPVNERRESAEPEPGPPELRTVVCGIDRSDEALEAARQALRIGADDADYWALSAWNPGLAVYAGIHAAEAMRSLRDESTTALQRAAAELPMLRPMRLKGPEVAALLSGIANLRADLVSVGSHGQSRAAGVLFGSVASAMVHHAPCSVLIARQARADEFPRLILHANDGSPESLHAARVAGELASRHDSTVVTVHVSEGDGHGVADEAVALLEATGREPVIKVEQGSPHRVIVETANGANAALIVMGSRGRTGVAALGSVSERVAHRADCSVLIVRSPSHPVRDDD